MNLKSFAKVHAYSRPLLPNHTPYSSNNGLAYRTNTSGLSPSNQYSGVNLLIGIKADQEGTTVALPAKP